MLSVTIVGHLGADAEIKSKDGREFMTFRVAHSNRYEKNGQKVEETQWINCLMHGDGGKLKEYLTKGQMVCVIGDASANIVSSPKLRRDHLKLRLFVTTSKPAWRFRGTKKHATDSVSTLHAVF